MSERTASTFGFHTGSCRLSGKITRIPQNYSSGANSISLVINACNCTSLGLAFAIEHKKELNKELKKQFNNPHLSFLTMLVRAISVCICSYKGAKSVKYLLN